MVSLLFIDDDPQVQNTVSMVLAGSYEVASAYTAAQGLARIRADDPDLVLLDVNLPDMDGIETLKRIAAGPSPPPVVMLTAYADTRLVVRAMKAGACDYLLKPLKLKALLTVLQNALVSHPVPAITSSVPAVGKLVGMSRGIMEMKELILRYGASMSPVLIQGESGTGKELVARAVHSVSGVSGAFVAINCGAIPEQLVEAELFGTEKGAYTDAQPRAGSFERADGGCLFLDEIGEMAMTAQVKLLRIMEEREVSRLGGTRPVPIDVRILAATNKSLSEGVKSGTFREDLYYRLAVLPIQVPSLREHPEDIPLLAASMLQELEGTGKKLSHEALVKLQRHSWPGNVRELRNVLERAVLLSEGPSLLPGHIRF